MSLEKIIKYKLKVEWGDCDPYGIVFYPNFYKWMDNAQWNYFKKINQSISKLEKLYNIKGLPLLHTEANFLSASWAFSCNSRIKYFAECVYLKRFRLGPGKSSK